MKREQTNVEFPWPLVEDILEVLGDAEDYFDNRSDYENDTTPYGPLPNKEAVMASAIKAVIRRIDRL
jgi:hypothetical protein